MPGIMQELISITSPTLSERFMRQQVAASLTAVALNVVETRAASGTLNVTGLAQPFGGSLVALTGSLSVAAGAGTLTLTATVNGVVTNLVATITTTLSGTVVQEYGSA